MGKRKAGAQGEKKFKKGKYNTQQNVEPGWAGIYATTVRGKEAQCRNELRNVFQEYAEDMYGDEEIDDNEDDAEESGDIEDAIAKELGQLSAPDKKKKERFSPIDTGCECVVFFRTRKPIEPVDLVLKVCEDAAHSGAKKSRYAQRLSPVTLTATANIEGVKRLAASVLKPHFHRDEGQEPLKFAIRPTIRNHNAMSRDEVIKTIAQSVGSEHGHKVDLKNYDKLILVEIFKSSVGMSVVDRRFESLERFNLEQIFQRQFKTDQKESNKAHENISKDAKDTDKTETTDSL
uniref:ARAD1B19382p n=1 Tax=Blastobotrys adeninivorans TaxID=409370 RepID=A0A060T720_BLAAD